MNKIRKYQGCPNNYETLDMCAFLLMQIKLFGPGGFACVAFQCIAGILLPSLAFFFFLRPAFGHGRLGHP